MGRWLFRWRGVTGFVAYWVVFGFGRPDFGSCLSGLPLLLSGLALRFWAMGYLGQDARGKEIAANVVVRDGPYRWLSHPLYTGNFLLVVGIIGALRPHWPVALLTLAGFLVEYGLFARAEGAALASPELPVEKRRFSLARARAEWPTWAVTGAAYGLAWAKALLLAR
ncbi:MAG: isoprenylcysteine carboxylmethyltransferase family protein [candidate division WOR-3 bacterium]